MTPPGSIIKNIINIMWLQMQWSPTLGLPDLRAELSAVRMDISNPYPNITDPSKPTLTWRTWTVRAAPRLRLGA